MLSEARLGQQTTNLFVWEGELPSANCHRLVFIMIKVICERCYIELKEFGAILLSPPNEGQVRKIHLCRKCYKEIIDKELLAKPQEAR